eukprot:1160489-Pelagomonas_calceolata.AAC.7
MKLRAGSYSLIQTFQCLSPLACARCRHGESHGNVEKSTYCTQPDHSVGLTAKGRQQAIATGQYLRRMLVSTAHHFALSNTLQANDACI